MAALMEQLLEDIQAAARQDLHTLLAADVRADRPVLIGSALNGNGIMWFSEGSATRRRTSSTPAGASESPDASKTLLQVMKTIHTSHAGKPRWCGCSPESSTTGTATADGRRRARQGFGAIPHGRPEHHQAPHRGSRREGRPRQGGACAHRRYASCQGRKKAAQIEDPAAPQAVRPEALLIPSRAQGWRVKFYSALARMVEEDPSLNDRQDTGETLLGGPGGDAPPRGRGAAHEPVPVEARDQALVPIARRSAPPSQSRGRQEDGGHRDVVLEEEAAAALGLRSTTPSPAALALKRRRRRSTAPRRR